MNTMTTKEKLISLLRYVGINGVFGASLYFGFIETNHEYAEGAENLALFIGWAMGVIGTLVLLAFAADKAESNENKGQYAETIARSGYQSIVPHEIDLVYDVAVLGIFIFYGHYVLAFFYILSIYAGKAIRDTPKNVMLKNLRSQKP